MNKYKQPEEVKIDDPTIEKPMYLSEILGSMETITAVPTGTPKRFIDQFKFYSTGGTYRLYAYDSKNAVWRYVSLT